MTNSLRCRREDARATVARASTVRASNEQPYDVTVGDLSRTGFSFTSSDPVPIGAIIHIGLAGAGRAAAQVTWRAGDRYGCRFQSKLSTMQLNAAFSQPIEASIAQLPPTASRDNPSVERPDAGFPPYLRLAAMAGSSMLGWALIAAWMRGLPPF
jgi:hypothetical protein